MCDMLVLLFVFIIGSVSTAENITCPERILAAKELNEIEYKHSSKVTGYQARFDFEISNVAYVIKVLNIESYYYSITYVDEEHQDYQTCAEDFPKNESFFGGRLNMNDLDHQGNYLVCVFFLKHNQTETIGSSRFCHVISVPDTCKLERLEVSFANQPAYILLILVAALLIIVISGSYIRKCIGQPKSAKDKLNVLSKQQLQNLEELANKLVRKSARRGSVSEDHAGFGHLVSSTRLGTNEEVDDDDDEFGASRGYDNKALSVITDGNGA